MPVGFPNAGFPLHGCDRLRAPYALAGGGHRVPISYTHDLEAIGRALEIRHEHKKVSGREISIVKAMNMAISQDGSKVNRDGEETDRLRSKLRKRLTLRKRNKHP